MAYKREIDSLINRTYFRNKILLEKVSTHNTKKIYIKGKREKLTCISNWSISLSTHPTEPSPEQINILNGSKCLKSLNPSPGPVDIISNTCAGFNNCLKRLKNLTPWLSPDFELTNTSNGE